MEKFNIGISLIVLLAIFDLVMSCCQSQSKHGTIYLIINSKPLKKLFLMVILKQFFNLKIIFSFSRQTQKWRRNKI
jgi:hypothetical protein